MHYVVIKNLNILNITTVYGKKSNYLCGYFTQEICPVFTSSSKVVNK